jgi:hypothetical protein
MPIGEFRQPKLDLENEIDRGGIPILVDVPTVCYEPILEVVQSQLAFEKPQQVFANLNLEGGCHLPYPVQRVTPQALRQMFNSVGYLNQVANGTLVAIVRRDAHPTPPKAPEPICTRSQEISYVDASGEEICRVHQYVRTDGTIGASGKPDPKRILAGGVIYRVFGR